MRLSNQAIVNAIVLVVAGDRDDLTNRKRYELPRPPGGYDRVLKRVGIQYCRISSTTAGISL